MISEGSDSSETILNSVNTQIKTLMAVTEK